MDIDDEIGIEIMIRIKTKTTQLYSGPGFKVYSRISAIGAVTLYWELRPYTEPKIVIRLD